MVAIEKKKLVDMYRTMVRIRAFEERVNREFTLGNIPGNAHLYTGEEAVATGACANLRPDDYITSTHRGHGHVIAKGARTDRMMAEIFGKKTGYCKGKGGSMHIADTDLGILGANGIVGAGITIAGGAALSTQKRRTGQVVICFLGDGATNTSRFHEGINLAACLKLPVVYIIENNAYAISTRISYACTIANIGDRAVGYGIPGVTVDGNDIMAVFEAVGEAVARARKGEGPTLVECKTYRWHGHHTGDPQPYRSKDEVEEWKKRDPILRFRDKLVAMGVLSESVVGKIDREVSGEIEKAVAFAHESAFPAREETLVDVYTVQPPAKETDTACLSGEMREVTFLQAINEAVDEEMKRDPGVLILGEDLRAFGAPHGEFQGLFEKYGVDRVIDTPISETAILGGAIGAAATGMRPIANIMYASFLGVCGDELLNQLTQMRYMFGGKLKLPVTIISYSGAGVSHGAQHAKTLYGWLMAITGLKIVVPSTPYDAKGLLKSVIREDNPTIFLSHELMLGWKMKSKIPDGEYTVPLGKADVKREGSDVTVVAVGLMVSRALSVAERLKEKGISIEVIDPRTLVPLDKQAIIESVKKTGRLVIMDEEPITGSAAGEIAAIVAYEAFDYLDAPIRRVCAPDTPVPFSPPLERFWIPDEEDLIKAIAEMK
jgi:TPP-dependent pyruvate/acetoin dehydrogenase alpha subunit/pyruvate/2-oxoglutarate/acetoin dehydrogenase E1 component